MPWVCLFRNQIESGLRLSLSYFFEQLSKKFCIPLCQFNQYSIRRVTALHILCSFYSIKDSAGFIHATHSPKKAPPLYYLSPRPSQNASFVTHKSIDRGYQQHFFCMQPTNSLVNWNSTEGRWHTTSTLRTTP